MNPAVSLLSLNNLNFSLLLYTVTRYSLDCHITSNLINPFLKSHERKQVRTAKILNVLVLMHSLCFVVYNVLPLKNRNQEQNRVFYGEQICISGMPPDRQRSAILTGLMN